MSKERNVMRRKREEKVEKLGSDGRKICV